MRETSHPDYDADRAAAQRWAADLLARQDWVIVDTETTGLDGQAEAVQVAVLACDGSVLCHQLIKPTGPVPPEASAVHRITDDMLADKPTFAEVHGELARLLEGKTVVCYNAAFDSRILAQSARAHGIEPIQASWDCAMLQYAAYVGEWSSWHGSYRYQRLPAGRGAHDALADCRATLGVIKRMATSD